MAQKKTRVAAATVTLVAGTIAVVWRDPDTTFGGTSEFTVELEYAPHFVWCQNMNQNASTALGVPVISALTANGCTLTARRPLVGGNAPVETGDLSTYRVYAVCRAADIG